MDKCPMCGYKETVMGQRVHTIMNNYVNKKDSKKVICANNDVDQFETLDDDGNVKQVWILQSVWQKSVQSKPIEGGVDVVHPSTSTPTKSAEPTIVNRLTSLPPTAPLTTTPVVVVSPEVTKGVTLVTEPANKPNPFASIKAPTPQEGPI